MEALGSYAMALTYINADLMANCTAASVTARICVTPLPRSLRERHMMQGEHMEAI